MVNPNPSFLSKRVKRRDPSGITSDRYEFLGLDQAEPDLGDPIVGPSSIGVNPLPPDVSEPFVLVSDGTGSGKRYWTQKSNLLSGGVLVPGSISVQNNGVRVGTVNIINDINFVGTGVTVDSIGLGVTVGVATVRITVTDVIADGDPNELQYHGSNGFVQGADGFVYNPINQRVGIGSTTPREKLDVVGNILISGITSVGVLTAREGYFNNKLTVGNFEISDNTTLVRISAGKVGIGTTAPTTTLDVAGDVRITGIATINKVNTTQLTSQHINNSGITTTNTLQVTGQSTLLNQNITGISTVNNQNVTGVSTVATLRVTNSFAGFSSATNSRVTGISTVGILSATTAVVSTIESSSVGIGTTIVETKLDVIGDAKITGALYASNGSGIFGQVLTSNGTGPATWESPGGLSAGAATSIAVLSVSDNVTYFPVFARTVNGISTISADSDGLSYNPSTNTLGIGTTGTGYNLNVQGTSNLNGNVSVGGSLTQLYNGQYWNVLTRADVGYGSSQVPINQFLGELAYLDSYLPEQFANTEVTTTSTSTITLDSLPTAQIRSAKYNVQVTCNGQLVGSGTSSSSASVTQLIGGTKYVHGSYNNVDLITSQGLGTAARANLNVTKEYLLTLDSIVDGVFNTETNTSGITTGTPVIFDKLIPTSAAENSRVTSLRIQDPGNGYTVIPTITIANPTNNPGIPGVIGIGSTATATVRDMILNNIYVYSGVTTSVGVGTIGIPTISFRAPFSGTGIAATGRLGFGVSAITISNPGFGITSIPTITFSGNRTTSPSAGITSVLVTNIHIPNPGFGYSITNYPTISFQPPTSGVSAAASVRSLGLPGRYIITPGIGYTVPPILTVSSPNVGINTGVLSPTLGIVTFNVTSPGFGYTIAPTLSISPNPTDFSGRVGMGITLTDSLFIGGSGYSNTPVFNVIPVGGIGTGAQIGLVSKDADTGSITGIEIVNPGFGYTVPPTINITDSTGVGAALTITRLFLTDVNILNIGYGLTQIPNTSLIAQQSVGAGASVTPILGIGTVNIVGFGSGYNVAPSVAVTAFDGITGAGASVVPLGLGINASFIQITNSGVGYTFIPSVAFSQPVGLGTSAIGITGVRVGNIAVSTTGIGFSNSIPTVGFDYNNFNSLGTGVAASVTSIRITNGYIDGVGIGYTSPDLTTPGISLISIPGIGVTVGFGVSSVVLNNLGIGYTLAPIVTVSSPTVGVSTAQIISSLGYPGILAGAAFTTGTSQIYYIDSILSSNSVGVSTGVGIGTLTRTDVADVAFLVDKPNLFVGGTVDSVQVVSPGSGYTSKTILSATNFDVANVGTGFSFITAPVNNYQISDIMLLQSSGSFSPSCDIIEYATLANNEILGSFSAGFTTVGINTFGNLNFTPTYENNTIKISRNKIDV